MIHILKYLKILKVYTSIHFCSKQHHTKYFQVSTTLRNSKFYTHPILIIKAFSPSQQSIQRYIHLLQLTTKEVLQLLHFASLRNIIKLKISVDVWLMSESFSSKFQCKVFIHREGYNPNSMDGVHDLLDHNSFNDKSFIH